MVDVIEELFLWLDLISDLIDKNLEDGKFLREEASAAFEELLSLFRWAGGI